MYSAPSDISTSGFKSFHKFSASANGLTSLSVHFRKARMVIGFPVSGFSISARAAHVVRQASRWRSAGDVFAIVPEAARKGRVGVDAQEQKMFEVRLAISRSRA